MSLVRIWAIAANGFREVIRDRVLYFIVFFAILLVLALRLLPEISATTENKIFLDLGLGTIGLLGSVLAILIGTGLVNKEITQRTVLVLIPKPISRAELIVGKHLGLFAVLGVMVVGMTAIYLALLSWSNIPYPFGSIVVSLIYLLIELALLAALALVFGVFTSEILAALMAFCLYLVGHLSGYLVELGKINDSESFQTLTHTLYLVLPDLERLNLRNEAVYGLLPQPFELFFNALYGLIYTVVLLAIAVAIFTRREF